MTGPITVCCRMIVTGLEMRSHGLSLVIMAQDPDDITHALAGCPAAANVIAPAKDFPIGASFAMTLVRELGSE